MNPWKSVAYSHLFQVGRWTGQRPSSRPCRTHSWPPACTRHCECAWGWPAAGSRGPRSRWTRESWCGCSPAPGEACSHGTTAAQAWGSLSRWRGCTSGGSAAAPAAAGWWGQLTRRQQQRKSNHGMVGNKHREERPVGKATSMDSERRCSLGCSDDTKQFEHWHQENMEEEDEEKCHTEQAEELHRRKSYEQETWRVNKICWETVMITNWGAFCLHWKNTQSRGRCLKDHLRGN